MNTLKPWEPSHTTYSPKGNTVVLRDFVVNQTTSPSVVQHSDAEIVHEPDEEIKIEPKKSKK